MSPMLSGYLMSATGAVGADWRLTVVSLHVSTGGISPTVDKSPGADLNRTGPNGPPTA